MATRSEDIDVRGVPVERHQEVLTSDAIELVGRLHEELDDTRLALLDARQERQAELDAGGTLDFVSAPEDFTYPTRCRTGAWRSPAPPAARW